MLLSLLLDAMNRVSTFLNTNKFLYVLCELWATKRKLHLELLKPIVTFRFNKSGNKKKM